MYARTKDWPLDGVFVDVDYDNNATPRRFEVFIEVAGELTEAQLERLEKVAEACPVRRSLETGIEVFETFALHDDSSALTTAGGSS